MTKLITRKTAIAAIISLTVAYPTIAAVPNTFSAGQPASAADVNENFTSLDSRIGVLESATAEPASSVAINCTADANALKNTDIAEDTTYNITGACTGPIYVEEDNVHLLGGSNASDSIVLPAGVDESAVWAGGAYNLQITNLFLDITQATTANTTGGIWARDAFVRLRDSRIQGGDFGIEPFRGAIIRLDGENSITDFAKAGMSASDQSNINTRGQTTVTSARTEYEYLTGISSTRGSSVDIRSGITISVPTDSNARAIQAESSGSIRVQNSGTVSITGDIRNYQNSNIKIQKGTINGNIDEKYSSSLRLENGVTINGDARIDESSSWIMYGGSLSGDLDVRGASSARLEDGIVITGDADVRGASNWIMYDGSIAGTIRVRRSSSVNFEGVTQTSDDDRAVSLSSNSTLSAANSSLGSTFGNSNASIDIGAFDGGTSAVKGIELGLGSVASIGNTSITADVRIFPSSVIAITNSANLNGKNIYGCNTPSYADDSVIGIGNPDTASDCPQ